MDSLTGVPEFSHNVNIQYNGHGDTYAVCSCGWMASTHVDHYKGEFTAGMAASAVAVDVEEHLQENQ